jgi:hypothetical protein
MTSDDKTTRRQILAAAGAAMAATLPAGAIAADAGKSPAPPAGSSGAQIGPTILEYLGGLEDAVAQIADTWRPHDPQYRADLYRQIMMNLAYGYFVYFNADAEHPDWSPLYNPVFACQPNPDDIYLFSPIRSDLSYRVSGDRGTTRKLIFVTQKGTPGTLDTMEATSAVNSLDEEDFQVGPDGQFEIIFSARRPAGYSGNWSELKPGADVIFVRYRMVDWEKERDPQLAIACLDPVPLKSRLTPEQIVERLRLMARVPANQNKLFYKMQNDILHTVGYNVVQPVRLPGLTKQVYWPAVFQLDDAEALIIETEMPKVRPYWNIQLNDPLYNAVEYVYRISSLNASTAKLSSDGKLRAVIALTDPGVPNWLDPFGYKEGTLYGRWYGCDTNPTAVIHRVPLAKLHDHLPKDTPKVTPQERAEELRLRIAAAQRRRRW